MQTGLVRKSPGLIILLVVSQLECMHDFLSLLFLSLWTEKQLDGRVWTACQTVPLVINVSPPSVFLKKVKLLGHFWAHYLLTMSAVSHPSYEFPLNSLLTLAWKYNLYPRRVVHIRNWRGCVDAQSFHPFSGPYLEVGSVSPWQQWQSCDFGPAGGPVHGRIQVSACVLHMYLCFFEEGPVESQHNTEWWHSVFSLSLQWSAKPLSLWCFAICTVKKGQSVSVTSCKLEKILNKMYFFDYNYCEINRICLYIWNHWCKSICNYCVHQSS